MTTTSGNEPDIVDDGPPISVPDTSDAGESGKLKMIVGLVRKCMGIKDIASMYVSAGPRYSMYSTFVVLAGGFRYQPLCWNLYLTWCVFHFIQDSLPHSTVTFRNTGTIWTDPISSQRTSVLYRFATIRSYQLYSINDSDDPFERMLAVLRFTFSKDLKFIVSPAQSTFVSPYRLFVIHSVARSANLIIPY